MRCKYRDLLGEMQIPISATLSLVIKGSKRDSFRCFEPSAEVVWREFAKVIVRPFVELLPTAWTPFSTKRLVIISTNEAQITFAHYI